MEKRFRFLVLGAALLSALFSCKPSEPEVIPVASVSLSATSLTLKEGDTHTLTATVSPGNATDKTVTWKSSDEGVVTVSGGHLKAVRAGSATITAQAGGKSATCSVKSFVSFSSLPTNAEYVGSVIAIE